MEGLDRFKIPQLSPLAIILLFFLLYSSISVWDPDFWWHINTGRYILKHKALPEEDPFTFTTPEGATLRKTVILKGYWLAQVALYGIYSIGGVPGIVLLRSIVLTLTLLLLYWFLRGTNPFFRILSIAMTGNVLFYFTGERPQTLTFPLVMILFILLEGYREMRTKTIFLLPLVTLIWSNIHGSVLFAIGIILIYTLATGITYLSGSMTERRHLYLLFAVCSASLLTSFISPAGFRYIPLFYSTEHSILGKKLIIEHLSPLDLTFSYGKYLSYYWLSLLVTGIVAMANLRRLSLPTVLTTISTLILSLSGMRYIVYFVLSSTLIFHRLPKNIDTKYIKWPILLVVLIVAISLLGYFNPFNFEILSTYPVETIERFKDTAGLRIFGYFDWGGFIAFNLPDSRVFIDGRSLDENVFIQYDIVIEGTEFGGRKEWEEILDRYKADMIILPWFDLFTGKPIKVIDRLMMSREWYMPFFNKNEVAFLRR